MNWLLAGVCLCVVRGQHWMEQPLDHGDRGAGVFQQRYFVQRESQGDRLVVSIGGEGPVSAGHDGRDLPMRLAEKVDATLIKVEHRFYGESMPVYPSPLSVSSLHHLRIEQALGDLEQLIRRIKTEKLHQLHPGSKVVTIGGSYSGALSAWFREEYPDSTEGALASSAVVQPMVEFPQFDRQTGLSLLKVSQECLVHYQKFIQSLSQEVERVEQEWGQEFVTRNRDDMLWLVSDVLAMGVQYGHKTRLCAPIHTETAWQTLKAFLPLFGLLSARDYDRDVLGQTEYSPSMPSARQWLYQCCTQVGWFQTPSEYQLRPSALSLSYYDQLCLEVFGLPIDRAGIEKTSQRYKGSLNSASRLIWSNGADDQWQWASLTQPTRWQHQVLLIECLHSDCGHCVDLQTPRSSDESVLTQARETELDTLSHWLA